MTQESFEALATWLLFDVICDSIYLLDLMWYKHRLMFIENGFWVRDRAKITQNYIRRGPFLHDLLALLPTGKQAINHLLAKWRLNVLFKILNKCAL